MNASKKTYCIDIDGTICTQEKDYSKAKPFLNTIKQINKLYDECHKIIFFTARGTVTGIDWRDITIKQFEKWGVKYDQLLFNKPAADLYIDDKALNIGDWNVHS